MGSLALFTLDAVDKLYRRPRKCLGFKTPYEVFEGLIGLDVRKSRLLTKSTFYEYL